MEDSTALSHVRPSEMSISLFGGNVKKRKVINILVINKLKSYTY